MTHRLADLAAMVGADLEGDPDRPIDGIATLLAAGPGDLSFLTNPRYRDQALASKAGALLVSRDLSPETLADLRTDLVLCDDAYRALADLMTALFPVPEVVPGVHETACVDASAQVDPTARVDAFAVVGGGSTLGPGVVIGAHAVVGRGCSLGAGTVLHPHVVIYDGTRIGERGGRSLRCRSGRGRLRVRGGGAEAAAQVKLPQVGVVVIGDDVEIGANSAVDRATFDTTTIGRGTKIDNLVQIGHNAQIGQGCILCGQAGVSGSSRIGDRVLLAGQAGVRRPFQDRRRRAGGGQVGGVFQEVEDGRQVAGIPAVPIAAWRRRNALQSRLPAMRSALRALERRVGELESAGPRWP